MATTNRLATPNRALTEAEHAALEALDQIQVRLKRLPFARDEADALQAAIEATEAAMRDAKGRV